MKKWEPYKVGQVRDLSGCFTEEFFLKGLTVKQIGSELGMPDRRMANGIFISYAVKLPAVHEFELGGYARYSTDKFVSYRNGESSWSKTKYLQTFRGKRMPIGIDAAKKAWRFNMNHHKLVKVLPTIQDDNDNYPPGGKASQIIVTSPIECHITQFLKANEVFQGVWG